MTPTSSSSPEQIPFINRVVNRGSDLTLDGLSKAQSLTSKGLSKAQSLALYGYLCTKPYVITSLYETFLYSPVGVALSTTANWAMATSDLNAPSALGRGVLGTLTYKCTNPVTDRVMETVFLRPFFSKHANKPARDVGTAIKTVSKAIFAAALTNYACNYFGISNTLRFSKDYKTLLRTDFLAENFPKGPEMIIANGFYIYAWVAAMTIKYMINNEINNAKKISAVKPETAKEGLVKNAESLQSTTT